MKKLFSDCVWETYEAMIRDIEKCGYKLVYCLRDEIGVTPYTSYEVEVYSLEQTEEGISINFY